jgi:protein TonB
VDRLRWAPLFSPRRGSARPAIGGPLALSSGLHLALLGAIVLVTTLGLAQATATTEAPVEPEPMRLVYLALPGPGGGGGGGGVKAPAPAPKAQRKGNSPLDSPVPIKRSPVFGDPPPRPKPDPLPEVVAPVVQVAASREDRAGVVEPTASQADSRGQGDAGGVGTGTGVGIGEGTGAGIGAGEDRGVGGGPYRPGSGVLPPSLLREVKPDYTEDARRRNVSGEVLMEIVVKRDGTVGDVKVLDGLGYGLDERAVVAVRQWRFSPATLHGKAVDVIVEVSMEFRLR